MKYYRQMYIVGNLIPSRDFYDLLHLVFEFGRKTKQFLDNNTDVAEVRVRRPDKESDFLLVRLVLLCVAIA